MRGDRNKWLCLICRGGPRGRGRLRRRRRVMTGVASDRSQRDAASPPGGARPCCSFALLRRRRIDGRSRRGAFLKPVLDKKPPSAPKVGILCHAAFAPLPLLLSRSGPGSGEGRGVLAGDQQAGEAGRNHQLPGETSQPGRSGEG